MSMLLLPLMRSLPLIAPGLLGVMIGFAASEALKAWRASRRKRH